MKEEFSAGGVVFRKDEGNIVYLLVYSKRNNLWGFPKGHISPGEEEMETAYREIAEETGLHDLKLTGNFREEDVYEAVSNQAESEGEKVEKHSIYFLFEVKERIIVVDHDEIIDYKWVRLEKALDLLIFPSTHAILKKANKIANRIDFVL